MTSAKISNSLAVKHLRIGYSNKILFADLTLPELTAGTVCSVLGANGSGKSTLLKTLCGLLNPLTPGFLKSANTAPCLNQPEIKLGGRELSKMPLQERVRHVGYVPQSLPIASALSPYEVVFSALKSIKPWLSRAQADFKIESVFRQLDLLDMAFHPMLTLSGGQRQLVAMTQILVRDAELLLLDEPTSALDLRWQNKVLETMKTRVVDCGAICLLVMHDLNLALRVSDYLIALSPEGLLAHGRSDNTLTSEIVSQLYRVESRIEYCSEGYPMIIVDRAL